MKIVLSVRQRTYRRILCVAYVLPGPHRSAFRERGEVISGFKIRGLGLVDDAATDHAEVVRALNCDAFLSGWAKGVAQLGFGLLEGVLRSRSRGIDGRLTAAMRHASVSRPLYR
jgi:hypothetical protein